MLTKWMECVNNPFAMPASPDPSTAPSRDATRKRIRILDAALAEFSTRGYSRTSMADIAATAEMSRPALYLHFRNKEEIFRAALEALLERTFETARAALEPARVSPRRRNSDEARVEERVAAQLDEFLQRYHGDLMEALTKTPHGDDFLVPDYPHAADIVEAAARRTRAELTRYFKGLAAEGAFDPDRAGRPAARWVELIQFSPYGLKQDHPSVALYRRRLEALATSVAAGMMRERKPG